MRLLYIANLRSVHDLKWMRWFSQEHGYEVYATNGFIQDPPLSADEISKVEAMGIRILPELSSFSISDFRTTFRSYKRLKQYQKEHKFDIVHILYLAPNAIWANYIDAPLVFTSRGSDVLVTLPELKSASGFRSKLVYSLFKKAFRKADYIVSTSTRQAENISKDFEIKRDPVIIRTGVNVQDLANMDADAHLPAELKGKNFIFFPRLFKPIYYHELAIEALKILGDRSSLKDHSLVFVRGTVHDEVYGKQIEAGLRDLKGFETIILDNLEQDEIWAAFLKTSLVVMVPKSDGTPVSGLEAMAARAPMILGPAHYDPQIFDGACIHLKEFNAQELAEAMQNALEDYPKELLEEGFMRVSQFGDRPTEMEKLHDIYKEIIGKA